MARGGKESGLGYVVGLRVGVIVARNVIVDCYGIARRRRWIKVYSDVAQFAAVGLGVFSRAVRDLHQQRNRIRVSAGITEIHGLLPICGSVRSA